MFRIESALDVGGGGGVWTAAAFTDRDKLKAGRVLLGLDPFGPDPRPPASGWKDALGEALGGARGRARPPADRGGFTAAQEDRGRTADADATAFTARVRNPALRARPNPPTTAPPTSTGPSAAMRGGSPAGHCRRDW